MIQQPSQYDCNNMQKGDTVFVRPVSPLYKFIRRHFLHNKPIIRVRDGWNEPAKYNEFYQEDCVLIYAFESACVQNLDNKIPYVVSKQANSKVIKRGVMSSVQVGLYNIQFIIDKNTTITIPTGELRRAIEKNQQILNIYEDDRKIEEAIKFQKFKGSYFKNYVITHNITEWTPAYCSVCGKPLNFKFNEDGVDTDNNCECKSLDFKIKHMTYDEFSLWYTNQIVTPSIIKRYNSFWFKE